ncbi:MAG: hypothetical protein Kow0069_22840 [Promethearchaeota archaeon]
MRRPKRCKVERSVAQVQKKPLRALSVAWIVVFSTTLTPLSAMMLAGVTGGGKSAKRLLDSPRDPSSNFPPGVPLHAASVNNSLEAAGLDHVLAGAFAYAVAHVGLNRSNTQRVLGDVPFHYGSASLFLDANVATSYDPGEDALTIALDPLTLGPADGPTGLVSFAPQLGGLQRLAGADVPEGARSVNFTSTTQFLANGGFQVRYWYRNESFELLPFVATGTVQLLVDGSLLQLLVSTFAPHQMATYESLATYCERYGEPVENTTTGAANVTLSCTWSASNLGSTSVLSPQVDLWAVSQPTAFPLPLMNVTVTSGGSVEYGVDGSGHYRVSDLYVNASVARNFSGIVDRSEWRVFRANSTRVDTRNEFQVVKFSTSGGENWFDKNEPVELNATVWDDQWEPVQGITVRFEYAYDSAPSTWYLVQTAATNQDGEATYSWAQSLPVGAYHVRVVVPPQSGRPISFSGQSTFSVYKKPTRIVNFTVNGGVGSCYTETGVTFEATLQTRDGTPLAGRQVEFVYSTDDGLTWTLFTQDPSTSSSGIATVTTGMVLSPGTYLFAARFSGDATYGDALSPTMLLAVYNRTSAAGFELSSVDVNLHAGDAQTLELPITNHEGDAAPCTLSEGDAYGILSLDPDFLLFGDSVVPVNATINVTGMASGDYTVYARATVHGVTHEVAIHVHVNQQPQYFVNPGGFDTSAKQLPYGGGWVDVTFTLTASEAALWNEGIDNLTVVVDVQNAENTSTVQVRIQGVYVNDNITGYGAAVGNNITAGQSGTMVFEEWTRPVVFSAGTNTVQLRDLKLNGVVVDSVQLWVWAGRPRVVYELGFAPDAFTETRYPTYQVNASQQVVLYHYFDHDGGANLSNFQFDYNLPATFSYDANAPSNPQSLTSNFYDQSAPLKWKSTIHSDSPGIYAFSQGTAWGYSGKAGYGTLWQYLSNPAVLVVVGNVTTQVTAPANGTVGSVVVLELTCRDEVSSALLDVLGVNATVYYPDSSIRVIRMALVAPGTYQAEVPVTAVGRYDVAFSGRGEYYHPFSDYASFYGKERPRVDLQLGGSLFPAGRSVTSYLTAYALNGSVVALDSSDLSLTIYRPDTTYYSPAVTPISPGRWSFDHSDTVLGNYLLVATLADREGSHRTVVVATWNRTAPLVNFTRPWAFSSYSQDGVPVIFATDGTGGGYELRVNDESRGAVTSGSMAYGLVPGLNLLTVRAWDSYGNERNASVVVDLPEAPLAYELTTGAASWVEINATGTQLSLANDDRVNVTLPFTFEFYGTSYQQVQVGSNGYISFDGTASSGVESPLPTASATLGAGIAVMWDDLDPSSGGAVYVRNFTGGNGLAYWICEWDRVDHASGGTAGTFQVVLYANGDVKLQYKAVNHLEGGVAGVNRGDGREAVPYSGLSQGMAPTSVYFRSTRSRTSWNVLVNEVSTSPDQLELINFGADVRLNGWKLWVADGDAKDHVQYSFPSGFSLSSGATVVVHSGTGTNDADDLYLGWTIPWTSGSAGMVALVDPYGRCHDYVEFGSYAWWKPTDRNWTGASLTAQGEYYRDTYLDFNDASGWVTQTPAGPNTWYSNNTGQLMDPLGALEGATYSGSGGNSLYTFEVTWRSPLGRKPTGVWAVLNDTPVLMSPKTSSTDYVGGVTYQTSAFFGFGFQNWSFHASDGRGYLVTSNQTTIDTREYVRPSIGPVGNITDPINYDRPQLVNATVTDAGGSGLAWARVYYRTGSQSWSDTRWVSFVGENATIPETAYSYGDVVYFYVAAQDNCGNEKYRGLAGETNSEASARANPYSFSVTDLVAPTIGQVIGEQDPIAENGDQVLECSISDASPGDDSGLDQARVYYANLTDAWSANRYANFSGLYATINETYYEWGDTVRYYVMANDTAGNVAYRYQGGVTTSEAVARANPFQFYVTTSDSTPPDIDPVLFEVDPINYDVNQNLSVNVTDTGGAGLSWARLFYKIDANPWDIGNYININTATDWVNISETIYSYGQTVYYYIGAADAANNERYRNAAGLTTDMGEAQASPFSFYVNDSVWPSLGPVGGEVDPILDDVDQVISCSAADPDAGDGAGLDQHRLYYRKETDSWDPARYSTFAGSSATIPESYYGANETVYYYVMANDSAGNAIYRHALGTTTSVTEARANPFSFDTFAYRLKNYTIEEGTGFQWIDATGGTDLGLSVDGYATVTLPFPFQFYNESWMQVHVSVNGYLSFTDSSPGRFNPQPFPSSDPELGFAVAPFWADLDTTGAGGAVYAKSLPDAWVVEWHDVDYWGTKTGTFEAILHRDGRVTFQYLYFTASGFPASATTGVNFGDGKTATTYDQLTSSTENLSVTFEYYAPYAFEDDLEAGLGNWQEASGLWHLTDNSSLPSAAVSPTHSAWFGQETTGTYDAGTRVAGNLTTEPFDLFHFGSAWLEFKHWREADGSQDVSRVYASSDGFAWTRVYETYEALVPPWQLVSVNLSSFCGNETVWVRFFFDSADATDNDHAGWAVDDVVVVTYGPAAPVLNPFSPAVDPDGEVDATWAVVPGATAYHVFVSTSPITSLAGLVPNATTFSNSYHASLGVEGTYFFAVVASNALGNSSASNVEVVQFLLPPAAPTLFPITPSVDFDGVVFLNWTDVAGATAYDVYRDVAPISDVGSLTPVGTNASSEFYDVVSATGTYYYVVVARNAGGGSPPSNDQSVQVVFPPGTPTLSPISPDPDDDGVVDLSWSAVPGAERYYLFASLNSIVSVAGLPPNATTSFTSYSFGVSVAGTYHFVVVANNLAGNGSMSNEGVVTVGFRPAAPTLSTITPNPVTDGQVPLQWSASAHATKYYVYRSTAPITSTQGLYAIAIVSGTNYTDLLTVEGTYYYVVVAANDLFSSDPSNVEAVTFDRDATGDGTGDGGDGTGGTDGTDGTGDGGAEPPSSAIVGYVILGVVLVGVVGSLVQWIRKKRKPWKYA